MSMSVADETRFHGFLNLGITIYKLYKLGKLYNFFVPQFPQLPNKVGNKITLPQRAVPKTCELISINYFDQC